MPADRGFRPRFRRGPGWSAAVLALLAVACTTQHIRPTPGPAPADVRAAQEPVSAERGSGRYRLSDAESRIFVRVFPDGRLRRLGHHHVVRPTGLSGGFTKNPDGSGLGQIDLRLADMRVDDSADRATQGDAFGRPLSEAAAVGTRRNMLGPVLEADRHPGVQATLRLPVVAEGQVEGTVHIRMHAVERRLPVTVAVSHPPNAIRMRGKLTIRQTDFGIRPFSTLAGALKVRDELDISFDLLGRP